MSATTQRRMAAATAILLLLTALQMVLSVGVTSAVASTVEPTYVAGNPTCRDFGDRDEMLKIEQGSELTDADSGTYTEGDLEVTITVYETEAGWEFDWAANTDIGVVVVKGGPGANVYTYTAATSDTGLHAPFNDESGSWYGLSHISLCSTTTNDTTPTGSASLTVVKDVNVAAPAADFDFTVTGEPPFELADGESETFTYTLDPASDTVALTVAEGTVPTDFEFVSVSCADRESTVGEVIDASVDLTLADGDDITCTFVNTYEAPTTPTSSVTNTTDATEVASITVVKSAAGAADQDFAFSFDDESFTLQSGGSETFSDLDAGTYEVTETNLADGSEARWILVQVDCTDGSTATIASDGSDGRAVVSLQEGEDVTCTFTNVLVAGIQIESTTTTVAPATTVAPVTTDTLPFTGLGAEEMLVLALVVSAAGGLLLFSTAREDEDSASTETIGRWSSN